jgi:Ca-activated chloride channel family protein
VGTFRKLLIALRGTLDEWLRLRWTDLQFTEARTAFFMVVVLLALSFLVLTSRRLWSRRAGRTQLGLPAVLPLMRGSYWSATRHGAFLLFLLGVPFFAVALADPHTAFTQEQVSYPGRRIAILIDSSSSMVLKFNSAKLQAQGAPTFYTAVAAAERFVQLRMKGPYHDLIALIQFGNNAYVVTPFTTDYQNVMLSMKLVSNPKEWGRFSDWGTTIIQGIEQGTELFKTFNFLNASGNLMLVFTDGRDDQATLKGRSLDDLVSAARRNKIPVYMIRTAFNMKFGDIGQDRLWKDAIERTGGHFYPAADEDAILDALSDIDRLSPGRIDVRRYTAQRPRFAGYALIAIALWLSAGTLKLGFRHFRTFP